MCRYALVGDDMVVTMTQRKMTVKIDLEEEKFTLFLSDNKKLADSLEVRYNRNLAEKLLGGLDNILKRNKIDKTCLKSLELLKKPDENRTSDRIAMSIVGAFRVLK